MLATRLGYTPATIRELELSEYQRFIRYWEREPSQRDLVAMIASALGVKEAAGTPASGGPDNQRLVEIPPEFED
jgi:hypothetical protein